MTLSTSNALYSSLSALLANQQALGIISNNIANSNSPGYSEEQINETPEVVGQTLQGVELNQVTRSSNQFLVTATQDQNTELGMANVLNTYYERMQSYYGNPDSATDTTSSGNSITDALNSFFTAVSALASDPAQASLTTEAVNQGVALTQNISTLASNLESTRFQADQDISSDITYINGQLSALQTINQSIRTATQNGQSTASMLDQRDTDLQNISQYMGINTNYQSDGEVSVSTTSGVDLLTPESLYQLSYVGAGSSQTFTNNSMLQPINVYEVQPDGSLSATPSDQLVSGGVSGATSGSDVITSKITGGALAGLMQIRDTDVPQLLGQLNNLASTITNTVNAVQNNGAGFPPASSLTGTLAVASNNQYAMSGSVMIGVTDSSGNPVTSPYTNQTQGVPPLTINLSTLNGGAPTLQDIVNVINSYYGSPPPEVSLGSLTNIQLTSVSDSASTGNNYTFNLNLQNYSTDDASVQITGLTVSGPGSSVVSGIPAGPQTVSAGTSAPSSNVTVNFGGAGPWTIAATVQVTDASTGVVSTDTIDYQISPAASGLAGSTYNFTNPAFAGDATIVEPTTVQPIAHAQIVDANGNPVAAGDPGFLQISTYNSSNGIAISELDSTQNGQIDPATGNILAGTDTGDGFSQYFGLNNFFVTDATGNSTALNMQVNNAIVQNPALMSTGQLTLSNPPATGGPAYTYGLGVGNNQAVQALSNLQNQPVSFAAASGLPALDVSLSNYSAEVIGFAAQAVTSASTNATDQQNVFNGLQTQAQSVSGVNVDDEMSNMLLYENAYEASAKIITTMQNIFAALEQDIT